MADLEARPEPGQDVVVIAPTGTKLRKPASYNSTVTRVRVKNTGVPPVEPPPDPPPPTSIRAISGFGVDVTGGQGGPVVTVTTLASTGPESLPYLLQGGNRIIRFAVEGTIHLPSIVRGSSNQTLDGSTAPGKGITLTGWDVQWVGQRNIIATDIRHRAGAGTAGVQEGHCLWFGRDTRGVIVARVSLSGFNDEGLTFWDRISDISVQDIIIGPGKTAAHNYAAIFGWWTQRVSFHHNLIYGSTYRNPAVGWDGDTNPPSLPVDICGDVRCNLDWDTGWGPSIYHRATGNVVKNWSSASLDTGGGGRAYSSGNGPNPMTGNVSTPFPVPSRFAITEEADRTAAARSVLDKAGCRVGGLDAYDQRIVDEIRAVIG